MKRLLLAALAALAFAPAASAMGTAGIVLDPKCLSESAWEVEPTAAPIKIYGCRPVENIPAPDSDGWTTYTRPLVDGTDAGFTKVKMLPGPTPETIQFLLIDSGGGSGNFGYKGTGTPGGDGVLQNPTVDIWKGGN